MTPIFEGAHSLTPLLLHGAFTAGAASVAVPAMGNLSVVQMHYRMRNLSLVCASGSDLGLDCPDLVLPVVGYAPPAEERGPFPVYLHTSGTGVWFRENGTGLPEYRVLSEMARRGFIAVMVEFPPIRQHAIKCNVSLTNQTEADQSLMATATAVYHRGPGSTSALATLCSHERADCARGIALLGHSIGGLIATLAPRVSSGISGMLLWGTGSRLPYGWSCCGLFSGEQDCCLPGAPIGGTDFPCVSYAATSRYFDRTRRRLIIYSRDHEYGDCYYADGKDAVDHPDDPPLQSYHCTAPNATNPWGALIIARRDSGYDCGDVTDCIQPDGSGYYIPSLEEVGATSTGPRCDARGRCYGGNGHNFHKSSSPDTGNITINRNWQNSRAPWGMRPSLDWLATTARRLLQ